EGDMLIGSICQYFLAATVASSEAHRAHLSPIVLGLFEFEDAIVAVPTESQVKNAVSKFDEEK
ncbi:hypothetical protein EK904_005151, partial [Melospiza melodia maxima]